MDRKALSKEITTMTSITNNMDVFAEKFEGVDLHGKKISKAIFILTIDTIVGKWYDFTIARELGYALVAQVYPQGLTQGGQLRYDLSE